MSDGFDLSPVGNAGSECISDGFDLSPVNSVRTVLMVTPVLTAAGFNPSNRKKRLLVDFSAAA